MNARVHIKWTMSTITYKYANSQVTHIIYKYNNGDRVEIALDDLGERWKEVIVEIKRADDNCEKREYRRRRAFLNAFNYGEIGKSMDESAFTEIERREVKAELESAICQLSPDQQTLIRWIYFLEIPAIEIAKNDGVSKSAISHRLKRALEKMKRFYSDQQLLP